VGERPRYNPGSPSVLSMCCNPEIITLPNKERKITQQTKKKITITKKKLVIKSNEDQCSRFYMPNYCLTLFEIHQIIHFGPRPPVPNKF
jgi:hypothetical protein